MLDACETRELIQRRARALPANARANHSHTFRKARSRTKKTHRWPTGLGSMFSRCAAAAESSSSGDLATVGLSTPSMALSRLPSAVRTAFMCGVLGSRDSHAESVRPCVPRERGAHRESTRRRVVPAHARLRRLLRARARTSRGFGASAARHAARGAQRRCTPVVVVRARGRNPVATQRHQQTAAANRREQSRALRGKWRTRRSAAARRSVEIAAFGRGAARAVRLFDDRFNRLVAPRAIRAEGAGARGELHARSGVLAKAPHLPSKAPRQSQTRRAS